MERAQRALGPQVSVLRFCDLWSSYCCWISCSTQTVYLQNVTRCFFSHWRVEAVFEVNTDLQKNVQAKITAHLTWPSVVNSSQRIMFPLTNTNSSSVSTNKSACHYKKVLLRFLCEVEEWRVFCLSAGGGGDPAESCWRPRLRPSSPLGPVTQPLSVFWKAGWQVRNLHAPFLSLYGLHSCSNRDLFRFYLPGCH